MVHGANGDKSIWNSLNGKIKEESFKNIKIICKNYNLQSELRHSSLHERKHIIKKIKKLKGKFIFIGHSIGGCLLASLLEDQSIKNRLLKFIALASPLEGISKDNGALYFNKLANKILNNGFSSLEFENFDTNKNYDIIKETVKKPSWVKNNIIKPLKGFDNDKIVLIAGNKPNGSKYLPVHHESIDTMFNFFTEAVLLAKNKEQSDGIIPLSSALCKNTLKNIPYKNKLIVPDCHTEIFKNNKVISFIIEHIKNVIKTNNKTIFIKKQVG